MDYSEYHALVQQYSKALDLFGPAVERNFIQHCQSAEQYAELLPTGVKVLDVGSGGGLPGIVVALKRPDVHVVLCEIRQRRASFLTIATKKLGLPNTTVFAQDVRKYSQPVAWVLAQAVAEVSGLVNLLDHTVEPQWNLITRRPKNFTVPESVAGYSVETKRYTLDAEHELLHLNLEKKV